MLYRRDGDQAASDQEHEDGEERNSEADLRLGQSLQRPSDGESAYLQFSMLILSWKNVLNVCFIESCSFSKCGKCSEFLLVTKTI